MAEKRPAIPRRQSYRLQIAEMSRAACVTAVEKAIRSVDGVTDAPALSSVTVVTNANRLRFFKPQEVRVSETIELAIEGMSCNHCVDRATQALRAVPGVQNVKVELNPGQAQVTGSTDAKTLIEAVEAAGYQASLC